MRFTPIGLLVISTVLHNQGAYLTPALVAGFIDTVVPFLIAAEIGRFVTRSRPKPAPGARAAVEAPPAAATPRPTT